MMPRRRRRSGRGDQATGAPDRRGPSPSRQIEPIPIPRGDPLETLLVSGGLPLDLRAVDLESPTLDRMRAAGVELVVPLIGQGELLGALCLGARLSDQPYSSDDRRLLAGLAAQVAPALQVAQLVRQQEEEAQERERVEQEMRVAALIQQTLLPRHLPRLAGWGIDAFYRPARAVGGDFYDFLDLPDGRLGVVIGDVTDKGVPAALVMATCRSMLRATAPLHDCPGDVLRAVNEALVPEIPPAMFVTCLYAIVDLGCGDVVFANAGHNLPYVRTSHGVEELRATGMPLGLMSGMEYEERTYVIDPGSVMVLTSDGITEAHDPDREMYGFHRLMARVAAHQPGADLVADLIGSVERFTGPGREQEDDITLVVVRRDAALPDRPDTESDGHEHGQRLLDEFRVASADGNERSAIDRVGSVVADLDLAPGRLERLKTAVGETTMNAMEHGNRYQPDLDVLIRVLASDDDVRVQVRDHGRGGPTPTVATPDLDAKLAGTEPARGWGLFLVQEMVDEVVSVEDAESHTVELVMNRDKDR